MTRFKALPRSRQIILAIVAAASLGCCGIVGLAVILPGGSEPTPTQAALRSTTGQPTDTLVSPTDTSVPPTATPFPPTQTPAPTETPEPTDTPVPTDSPQPTDTPQPSATPEPPTQAPTQLPTDTPAPEPTKLPEIKVVVDIPCCQFNAPGDDSKNPEEEWVCFKNKGGPAADMTNWTVIDEYGWTFSFPSFILAPESTVRVVTGCGTNTVDTLYWCRGGGGAVWNNDGDTVHLYDAAGNLVAEYSY